MSGCAQPQVAQLHFVSQGQSLSLKPAGAELLVDQSGRYFLFNQKVLVITALDAPQLQAQYRQISAVQQLAALQQQQRIYLLTLTPGSFFQLFPQLQANPQLLSVEPDLALQRTRPAAGRRISQAAAPWDVPATAFSHAEPLFCRQPANKVRVAIIDDGFDLKQPGFSGLQLALSYDADNQQLDPAALGRHDSHGTKVASVIVAQKNSSGEQGLAPESELIAISQKSSWSSAMVLAFNVAKMMKADVINCSWGLSFVPESLVRLIDDISLQPQQPQIVVAGGNKPEDACSNNVLSQLPQVLTVGAMNPSGRVANFSVRGPCVKVFAPYYVKMLHNKNAGYFSGTSSSAAIVSGVLARAKACGHTIALTELINLWKQ